MRPPEERQQIRERDASPQSIRDTANRAYRILKDVRMRSVDGQWSVVDAAAAASSVIDALEIMQEFADSIPSMLAEIERLEKGAAKEFHEVEQRLGQALGYPWYKDDPKNFPDATEADGVCVGEHVPGTLAAEAAHRIERLEKERDEGFKGLGLVIQEERRNTEGWRSDCVTAEAQVARLTTERDELWAALDEVRVESRDGYWFFSPNGAEAFIEKLPERPAAPSSPGRERG